MRAALAREFVALGRGHNALTAKPVEEAERPEQLLRACRSAPWRNCLEDPTDNRHDHDRMAL